MPRGVRNGMDEKKKRGVFFRAQWILYAVVGIALMTLVAEWIAAPPHTFLDAGIRVLYGLMVVELLRSYRWASWIIIIVSAINEVVPSLSYCDELWGTMIALFILGYKGLYRDGVIAVCLCTLSLFGNYSLYGNASELTSYGAAANNAGLFCIMFLLGVACRQYRNLRAEKDASDRLRIVKNNIRMASQMHDVLSGSLNRIVLAAQDGRDMTQGDDRLRWLEVADTARLTLHELHSAMDYLEDGSHPDDMAMDISLAECVESAANTYDRHLRDRGFAGDTTIRGITTAALTIDNQEVLDLLHEVYTNIERHSDQAFSDYQVIISCTDRQIDIVETNSCRHGKHWTAPLESGYGLSLHACRIAALGGTLRYGSAEEAWSLHGSVPLINVEECRAHSTEGTTSEMSMWYQRLLEKPSRWRAGRRRSVR